MKFHWIIGNHDKRNLKQLRHFATSVHEILDIKLCNGQKVTICHYPMLTWNCSHHGAWMLHGHHHINNKGGSFIETRITGKVLNINCEFHNYKPLSEIDIIAMMENKPDNFDLIKRN